MICTIHRSEKKQGAYLYLAHKKTLEDIPEELRQVLGTCIQVMHVNLAKRDKLASQDIDLVKQNLLDQGYHLQIPPKITTGVINYRV